MIMVTFVFVLVAGWLKTLWALGLGQTEASKGARVGCVNGFRWVCVAEVLGHAVVIGGKTLKVHLSDVTLAAWDDLHKKLQAHGYVHVLAGEALQEQRKRDEVTRASKMRRAEMLSDVESMLAGMRELAELHGVGGKGTKRHRFARVLGRCLDRSSRVAAYNLREAEEENPDLSDDAD